jgi:hypothetical protein
MFWDQFQTIGVVKAMKLEKTKFLFTRPSEEDVEWETSEDEISDPESSS